MFPILFLLGISLISCNKDPNDEKPIPSKPAGNEQIVKTEITGTRNFSNDTVYILEGNVFVRNGAILNIAPGTIIKGDKQTKGSLIVERGAKLNAKGTVNEPIVFTSKMKPGERAAGDWGGVIICGKAPVNQNNPSIEGVLPITNYGGNDPNDNSGCIQYVRIEFAGIALAPDKEINGLTFCGVGSATTVDHIQVSYSGDDSFEWFGGKVNAKYIFAYLGLDDDFDTDFGYSGKVQFALGVRHPRIADVSTSNGFESDNCADGSDVSPYTAPVFSNVSLIGPYRTPTDKNVNAQYGAGMHLRRSTALSAFNTVVAGWNTAGIMLEGSTKDQVAATNLVLANCFVVGTKTSAQAFFAKNYASAHATWFASMGNSLTYLTNDSLKIANAFYRADKTEAEAISMLEFKPKAGSALLNPANASFASMPLQDPFFDKTATFVGAIGTDDWTQEAWVNLNPQNTKY